VALVEHLKCQDNAASTTVIATVGSNGTLVGGDNTSAKSEVDGPGTALTRSFNLNAIDDAVTYSGTTFGDEVAFSFAGWAKCADTNGQIFGHTTDNNRAGKISDTSVRIITDGGATSFTVPSLGTGTWHHFLITRTAGNSVRVFVDKVESSSGAQTRGGMFVINAFGIAAGGFIDANVCDLRVYNTDESANVVAIYNEKDTAGGSPVAAKWHHLRQMSAG
jgi:hypothetical protein